MKLAETPIKKGGASAVEDTAEKVAAEAVGAEPVRGRGRLYRLAVVGRHRIVGRDQRCDQRGDDADHDQRQAQGAKRVAKHEARQQRCAWLGGLVQSSVATGLGKTSRMVRPA